MNIHKLPELKKELLNRIRLVRRDIGDLMFLLPLYLIKFYMRNNSVELPNGLMVRNVFVLLKHQ